MKKRIEQEELFERDSKTEVLELNINQPTKFKFKITLIIQPTLGNTNPNIIPVASGACYGEQVEEIINKTISSDYFKRRLRAVVGDPQD